MTGYVPNEDGTTWVNTDAIESIQVVDTLDAGHQVHIVCATGQHHVYSTLIVDQDHGCQIAAELVGQILGREQERPTPPATFVPE